MTIIILAFPLPITRALNNHYWTMGRVPKALKKKAIKPFKWNVHAVPFVPAIKEQAKEDAAPAAEPTGLNPEAAEFVPSANGMPTTIPTPIPTPLPTPIPTLIPMYIPSYLPPWGSGPQYRLHNTTNVAQLYSSTF
ncbi:hypothetical protein DFS34DRAFT_646971 [Phlyctochytrium arcticum]|nr:hypothetical protein DFS34DRAFT_646971 [Phlyctochytrium arcticum]